MEIEIIQPRTEHTEAIADLCSHGWKQTVEGKLSEAYQQQNVEFWYNHEKVHNDILAGIYSYVAIVGSNVVGVIGGAKIGSTTGEVFVLYVDETIRYQGIGKKLLHAFTEEQLENDVTEQWVSVQEGNQLGIPFYEARGFIFDSKRNTYTKTNENQVSLRYSRQIG